jgi:hypothetical protein
MGIEIKCTIDNYSNNAQMAAFTTISLDGKETSWEAADNYDIIHQINQGQTSGTT